MLRKGDAYLALTNSIIKNDFYEQERRKGFMEKIAGFPHIEICRADEEILADGESVKSKCFDLFPSIIEFVNSGVVDFVISQDLKSQSDIITRMLFEQLCENKSPEKIIHNLRACIKFALLPVTFPGTKKSALKTDKKCSTYRSTLRFLIRFRLEL